MKADYKGFSEEKLREAFDRISAFSKHWKDPIVSKFVEKSFLKETVAAIEFFHGATPKVVEVEYGFYVTSYGYAC